MSQWTMTVGNYGNQSSKGMQRTAQTGKNVKQQTINHASAMEVSGESYEAEGVDFAVSQSALRVSQWMLSEDVYYQQMATNLSGKTEPTPRDEIKTAKEIMQEQVDALLEEAQKNQEELKAQAKEEAAKKMKEASAGAGVSDSSIEYMERLLESMKKSREVSQKEKTSQKRALNYNYRRVSGAIMRAKSVTQAGNALTSAKSNLSNLRRKASSGKYEDSEISIAVSHARKMIRTARKKLQNVKQEEQLEKRDGQLENTKEREHNTVSKIRRKHGSSDEAKSEKELILLKRQLKQHRMQRKNAHRRDENHELLNADMEYLKKKIELMRQEQAMDKIAASKTARLQMAIAGGTGTVETSETTGGMESASNSVQAIDSSVNSSSAPAVSADGASGTASAPVSTGFSAMV